MASESVLAALSARGEEAAFDAIVWRHRAELLRHASSRLANREAALDCVQETLLRAWESLPRFRGECSLQTWLYRILENVCLEEQCRRAREPRAESLVEQASPADVSTEVGARQDIVSALKAMARLPIGLRATALLSLVEGLSSVDSAGILGISEEAARMRLSRARALITAARLAPDEAHSARTSLAEGYHFLGSLLLRQGKEAESDRAVLRGLELDPDTALRVYRQIALTLDKPWRDTTRVQAIRVLRQAFNRWPDVPMVRLAMANIEYWVIQHDAAAAERLFREAGADRGEAGALARYNLAQAWFRRGSYREALSLLEPLTRAYPKWDFAILTTAASLAMLNEPAARAWAQRARDMAMRRVQVPRSQRYAWVHAGWVRDAAAEVFAILGDWNRAAQCLRAGDRAYTAPYPHTPPEERLRDLRARYGQRRAAR